MARPSSPPAPLAALAAVAALALAGCGAQTAQDSSENFRGDERLVAQAVEDLQEAAARGDAERMCRELLARELVQRFEQAGGDRCVEAVEEAVRDADSFELTVQSVDVSGGRATARVQAEAGERRQTDTVELVREGSRWKVSALQAQA